MLENIRLEKAVNRKSIKVLGGIDTLYFFVNYNSELYHKFFKELVNFARNRDFTDNCFYNYEYLGSSGYKNGFCGYFLRFFNSLGEPLARIGFKNPNMQKNVKNVYVQLEAESIYTIGILDAVIELLDKLNDIFGQKYGLDDCIVSRADINAFINYDFKKIEIAMFRTILSKEGIHFGENYNVETLYLGNKHSPVAMKLYNKLLEMQSNVKKSTFLKKAYIKYFYKNYKLNDLWNLEFSFKREALKQFKIDNLNDLFKSTKSLYLFGLDYCCFLGFDVKAIKKARKNNKQHLLQESPLWTYIKNNIRFDDSIFSDEQVVRSVKKATKAHLSYYIMMIKSQINHINNNGYKLELEDFEDLKKELLNISIA